MSHSTKISIIIVNYNVKEFLANCLQSVKKSSDGIETEIFVVDNNSSDGSMEFLKPRFPEVKFIENSENLGFGKANNQAIRQASGKYTLILNPDTLLQEDTLRVLVSYMDKNPETGACGCKILNPDGTFAPESRRSVPTVSSALYKALGLTALFPRSKIFGKYYQGWKDEDEMGEVPVLSGSFMFFRTKTLLEVEGFDERFFMYGEDIDLCYRVTNSGWKIDYVPSTSIIHYKGESTKKDFRAYNRVFNNALYLFFDKHYTSRYSSFFRFLVFWAVQLRTVLSFMVSKIQSLKFVLVDLLILNGALLIGYVFRLWLDNSPVFTLDNIDFLFLNVLLSILYLVFTQSFGVLRKNRFSIVESLKAVFISFILLAAITFFIRTLAFSRIILAIAGLISFVGVGLVRFARINREKKIGVVKGKLSPLRVLVAGVGENTDSFISKLNGKANWQVEIVGVLHQSDWRESIGSLSEPIIGSLDQLDELVEGTRADTVIFLMNSVSHTELLQALKALRSKKVEVKVVPDSMNFLLGKAEVEYLDDVPLLDLEFNYYNTPQKAAKRLFDIGLSFLATTVLLPLAIGLIFKRGGFKPVPVYTGHKKSRVYFLDSSNKWRNRLLSAFWVLTGRLSFVGAGTEVNNNSNTHRFKTGLTGYSQINSERIGNMEESERFDLYYLQNYSVWLDIDILFKAFLRDESITARFIKSGTTEL